MPTPTANEDNAPVAKPHQNAAPISPSLIAAVQAAIPPETNPPITAEEINPTINKIAECPLGL